MKKPDPEIEGIRAMVEAMEPFDLETRQRMLRYADAWANDPKTVREGPDA